MIKDTQHVRQLIQKSVCEVDASADIILYGSRARGEAQADSDWDILILTDYPVSTAQEKSFRNGLYDLEVAVDEVFSVFIYSKIDWFSRQRITPFFENVMQEGIRL